MNTSVLDRSPIEAPIHLAREGVPLLMAPVCVNGQGPFEFILDTGNGQRAVAVSKEVADKLGIESREVSVECHFPVGLTKSLSAGEVDSLEIGGLKLGRTEVGVWEALSQLSERLQAPVDGNLGYYFFKDYVVGLDFERWMLTLSQEPVEGTGAPFEVGDEKPLIVVDVEADGAPLRFVLDTGASYNCLSPEAARRLGLALGAELAVNGSELDRARMCRLDSLTVAGQTQRSAGIVAADFVSKLGDLVGSPIDGVLGYSFWGKFRLAIDYPRGRLHLSGSE